MILKLYTFNFFTVKAEFLPQIAEMKLSLRGEAEAISFPNGLPRTLRVLAMTGKSMSLLFYR